MTNPDPADQGDDMMMSLREMAIYAHEAFTSLVEAGFTEDQALRLLAEMLRRPR